MRPFLLRLLPSVVHQWDLRELAKKQHAAEQKRGRAQDRAKVAGGQKHEVRYEAAKTGASAGEVRQAVKDVGNSRKRVEQVSKK